MSTESIRRINGIVSFGWEGTVCKYCGQQATMSYMDEYACTEHRNQLLMEKA